MECKSLNSDAIGTALREGPEAREWYHAHKFGDKTRDEIVSALTPIVERLLKAQLG